MYANISRRSFFLSLHSQQNMWWRRIWRKKPFGVPFTGAKKNSVNKYSCVSPFENAYLDSSPPVCHTCTQCSHVRLQLPNGIFYHFISHLLHTSTRQSISLTHWHRAYARERDSRTFRINVVLNVNVHRFFKFKFCCLVRGDSKSSSE